MAEDDPTQQKYPFGEPETVRYSPELEASDGDKAAGAINTIDLIVPGGETAQERRSHPGEGRMCALQR